MPKLPAWLDRFWPSEQSPLSPRQVAPRSGSPKATQHQIVFDAEHSLAYTLRRSSRRTIGLRIGDAGLCVTAPKQVGQDDIERVLREKQRWILRHLDSWQQRLAQREQTSTRWENGSTIPYLGTAIQLHAADITTTRYSGNLDRPLNTDTLWLALAKDADAQQWQAAVQRWLKQQAQVVLSQRLEQALQRTGLQITAWGLSSAKTRWGSCNSRGMIKLSWRLIHLPVELIDYVIVHELAHLREMNHGPAFWAHVETLMPEYRAARQALRAIDPGSLPTF